MARRKRRPKGQPDESAARQGGLPLRGWIPKLSPDAGRAARRGLLLALTAFAGHWALTSVVLESSPFRVGPGPDGLLIEGLAVMRPDEIREVFASDIGRSLQALDLDLRLRQLREVRWMHDARVRRFWPNTIAVTVVERTPVAFLRLPGETAPRMIDAAGVILDVRGVAGRPLPVLAGIGNEMPWDGRMTRMRLFHAVMEAFAERQEQGFALEVAEVDVSDAANAVVLTRHGDRMVPLLLGNRNLHHRLEVLQRHLDAWQEDFGPLESIDLRLEGQVALVPEAKQG